MEIKVEVDKSLCLDKQTYYDFFSKKVRYINRYDSVKELAGAFPADIDRKLYKQGLKNAVMKSEFPTINIKTN